MDAFNPQTGWIDTDVIGINAGIILMSAENGRTGNVWRWFMSNQEVSRAMNRIGLVLVRAAENNRLPLELDAGIFMQHDLQDAQSWLPIGLN